MELVLERKTFDLQRAFRLFDPNNIFGKYYLPAHMVCVLHVSTGLLAVAVLSNRKFLRVTLQAFMQSRFADADRLFGAFQTAMADANTPPFRVGTREWVNELVHSLLNQMLEAAPTDFERCKLLKMLVERKFSDQFAHRWSTFQLVQRLGIKADLNAPPEEIVALLLDINLFDEARSYSAENGLDLNRVTIQEILSLMEQYRRACLWELPHERMVRVTSTTPHDCAPWQGFNLRELVRCVVEILAPGAGLDETAQLCALDCR